MQAAEIFEHPRELIYKASKNLVINGVEIYTQLSGAIDSYKKNQFYDFGYHLGLGLDELVLKGAVKELGVKSVNNLSAYKFLTGFLHPIKLTKEPNYQYLYNSIKNGISIMGPVSNLMKELEKSKSYISLKSFMQLHEFAHYFREQG